MLIFAKQNLRKRETVTGSGPASRIWPGFTGSGPASQDLARLHLFISRRLSSSTNCSILPACDLLLTGKKNSSPEEALSAFSTWGAVHGSNSNYTSIK